MDFGLERLKRNAFTIYADIPVTRTFGNDSITEDLAVPDARHVKEFEVLDSEQHFDRRHAGDVAVDADKIHVSVIGKSRLEEHRICSHVGHLQHISGLRWE